MKFYGLLKDGALLQRGRPIVVNGECEEGDLLVFAGGGKRDEIRITPDASGSFRAKFPPVDDIENKYTVSLISGEKSISATVRFGDVFLTLGQSNMAYGVGATINREEILSEAKSCDISVFDIFEADVKENGEIYRPATPQDDFAKDWKWTDGSSPDLGASSAVAVSFACGLYRKTGVPIGVVNTALGGVSIDTYLPRNSADDDEVIKNYLISIDKYIPENGKYNIYGGANYSQLGGIYNEKIHPLKDNFFKGILWYQGENGISSFRAAEYFERALKKIISVYRSIFGEETFFVATEVAMDYYDYAPYGYNYINESIERATDDMGAVSFPAYDASTEWLVKDGATYYHPIHPVDKRLIASRFVKSIYSSLYEGKPWVPPRITDVRVSGDKMTAKIFPPERLRDKKIYGFTIAGKDGKFVEADCKETAPGEIEVSSPYVKAPVEFTYAFSPYNTRCNLITESGDAVRPYRKDFEDVSAKKYLPLNCFGDCSLMYFDEKNFGADLGCIGKAEVFADGRITRTGCTSRRIVEVGGEKMLRVDYNPNNEGYYFFGISPEVNIPSANACFGRFDYLSVIMKADGEDVAFWGGLVRGDHGAIHRFVCDTSEKIMDGEFREYVLYLTQFVEPSLGRISATEEAREAISVFELYFRSKTPGTIFIKSIKLHD